LVGSSNIRSSSPTENQRDDLLSVWDGDGSLRRPNISQSSQRHHERYRDTIQTVDRDGLLSALHLANELGAETGPFAESGLAIVPALSKFSKTLPEKLPNVGNRALGHGVVTRPTQQSTRIPQKSAISEVRQLAAALEDHPHVLRGDAKAQSRGLLLEH
jgi:hypothetical protein